MPRARHTRIAKESTPYQTNVPDVLSFLLADCLELVDWIGRHIREDKRSSIDNDLRCILTDTTGYRCIDGLFKLGVRLTRHEQCNSLQCGLPRFSLSLNNRSIKHCHSHIIEFPRANREARVWPGWHSLFSNSVLSVAGIITATLNRRYAINQNGLNCRSSTKSSFNYVGLTCIIHEATREFGFFL